jgi:hypothetical protein
MLIRLDMSASYLHEILNVLLLVKVSKNEFH